MKRFIAYLLLCCSMLIDIRIARAEAPLRYAATVQELLTNWLKDTYPEITCELAFGPSSTAEALALLQDVNAPDIMMVQSNRVDIYALLQSGLLEDLSSNEKIQLGMAQIYQPFRELVSGKNGEIYGVPYAVFSRPCMPSHPPGRRPVYAWKKRPEALKRCWTSHSGGSPW